MTPTQILINIHFFLQKYKLPNNYSSDVGTGLYGVLCKKFGMSLLHDHSGHMVIPGPFQRLFKNTYLIFKPTYFITISFIAIS